uniref:leucine-rich repeat-containing protein 4C-like n=1 Tax=Myxine glutinosa TaxID=7769 RepID=UPI00358F31BE
MPTPRFWWESQEVLFVFFLCCCAIVGPATAQSCPSKCRCMDQMGRIICLRKGLSEVPAGVPPGAHFLNLQENNLHVIKAGSFRHLHQLKVLQLGKNYIRQVEVGAFHGLFSLTTLELIDNRLTVIPSSAFDSVSKLQELWLRRNPIESIPSYAFRRLGSLQRLDLGALKYLQFISDSAFEGLTNLQYLNLGMCQLTTIPNLQPLVLLEELDLSGNRIATLVPGCFKGLGNLRKLQIINAGVQFIHRNAFDELQQLTELNLAHNVLNSLPYKLFSRLPHLAHVFLQGNPWLCDCDALWLGFSLRHKMPQNDMFRAVCAAPAELKERSLRDLDPESFSCYAPVIVEPPTDLNVTEGSAAELRCRAPSEMTSVAWFMPNGTMMTHGSYRVRISVLEDGSLNFTKVTLQDTGVYTCLLSNAAGNATAMVNLNVTSSDSSGANYTYFTTVTVEMLEPADLTASTSMPDSQASPSGRGHAMVDDTSRPQRPADSTGLAPGSGGLDEVMKTTKIIIGCFVAITLMAAAMLVVFYKLRKQHHRQGRRMMQSRAIEIINVEEDIATSSGTLSGRHAHHLGLGLSPPVLRKSTGSLSVGVLGTYNTYKPPHPSIASYSYDHAVDSLNNAPPLHSLLASAQEPLLLRSSSKEIVQETQI